MSAPELQLPGLVREVLPNGLVVLIAVRRSLPLVSLRLALRAGGAQEPPERTGLSAMTARLLRRGAGKRDAAAFAEELDFLGALMGSGAGLDHVAVDAEFTTATLDAGLSLFLDAVVRPRFDRSEFEAERRRVIDEIRHGRDDTEELAEEALLHALFPGHPFGRCAVASVRAMERLRPEEPRDFHRRRWSPQGAVLAVVGDVDPPALLARLRGELGAWGRQAEPGPVPPSPEPIAGRPVLLVNVPGSRQVQLRLGQVGVARDTPHRHALHVANTVLGGGFTSRLVDRVRVDEGLTYAIGSRFHPGRVPGPFVISSFTENPRLERLHGLVDEILQRFREEGPTEEEVRAARAYLAGIQPRRLETPGGLALALAEAELHGEGPEELTAFRARIEAVSREQAAEAARACLPGRDLLTVLVGDAEEIGETAARLGDVSVVELDFAESLAGPAEDGD